ncbi:MAG TPA: AAA family ATPase [Candidatus Limnocylindrales bacterium]
MGSVSSPILVGRDRELAQLDDALDRARAGAPSLLVVAGEAGIGKSRLIAEATDRAGASGARPLVGACLDLADGLPYLPFVEAMRRFVRTASAEELATALGPSRREFARLLPEMPFGGNGVATEEPPISQGTLFELGLGMIGRLGEVAPLLLVLEDVHWIDRSSRDLVTFLARNLAQERIAVVLTARTDHLPAGHPTLAWLSELGRLSRVERLELGRLTHDDVRRQLTAILGSAPSASVVDEIWTRSDGNPFFAEELLAASSGPPATLAGMLAARLAALSDETRELLPWLAVAGRPVDEALLATVTGRPADDLAPALVEGVGRHVLARTADTPPGFHFRHALVAEVAAAGLLDSQRRAIHERFAEALAARPGRRDRGRAGSAAEIAFHWAQAGRWPEAYRASIDAAAAAESVAAPAQALTQFERALAIADRLDPPPDAPELIALAGRASRAAELAGDLDRALELARHVADHDRAADLANRAARARAEAALEAGEPERALEVVERATGDDASAASVAATASLEALVAAGLRAAADLAETARAAKDRRASDVIARRAGHLRERLAQAADSRSSGSAPVLAPAVALADAEWHRLVAEPADWAGVAAALDSVPDPPGAAYARFRAAEQELRAHGVRADAESLLRSAFDVAARGDSRWLVKEIEGLARRARIRLGPDESEPSRIASAATDVAPEALAAGEGNGKAALRKAGLSPREIEVLRLVAAGRTNGEIAERLFITRKTAGVHVTHILDKLAVSNRVEAAMVAARLGLAPADDGG